ncbi:Hypothetical protein NTJ_10161 [Nesidiocoris tenuis]|uniref:THAP-type domain-containing protein n=1 Tax=Nesidiocoris tenuis TaxID=355587 RepID=A0ABN7AYX2_9HEMI|nr:Hypothetical protein NTJ_10161 [Nesidiocoris tenuis]
MGFCCAFGCSNRSDRKKKKDGVGFHRFPKDEKLRKLWVQAVCRKNWKPSTNTVICTEHFAETDVNRTYPSGPKLRENVIPTVFPAYPAALKKFVAGLKPPCPPKVVQQAKPSTSHIVQEIPAGNETGAGSPAGNETGAGIPAGNESTLEIPAGNETRAVVDPEPVAEPKSKDMSVQADDFVTKRLLESLQIENKQLRYKVDQLITRVGEKTRAVKLIRKKNYRLEARANRLTALVNTLKLNKRASAGSACLLKSMNGEQKDLFQKISKNAKVHFHQRFSDSLNLPS